MTKRTTAQEPSEAPPSERETTLLAEVSALRDELKELKDEKSFGLWWDDISEEAERQLVEKLPVLVEQRELAIEGALPGDLPHLLVEGDNLHALHTLQATHTDAVDLIYIDPPYNTGQKFRYNDRLIAKDSPYRHSAWLSFMSKRLKLAKTLLKRTGAIFISIDEHEFCQLALLGDSIFGEANRIGFLPRLTKKGGKTTSTFASNHDFLMGWARNKALLPKLLIPKGSKDFPRKDEFAPQRGRHNLKQTLDYDSLTYSKTMDYPLQLDGTTYYAGGDKEAWEERQKGNHKKHDWAWRWSQALVDWGAANGFIEVKKGRARSRIYTKSYERANYGRNANGDYEVTFAPRTMSPSSAALMANEFSNDVATKELRSLVGPAQFDFPKPTSLVRFLVDLIPDEKAVVLDFFAGSGTTLHAVAQANAADGGDRRCVLVTNNENQICREVTHARVEAALTGKWKFSIETPLPGSLRFYSTALITRRKNLDQLRADIAEHTVALVAIKETTRDTAFADPDLTVLHGRSKTVAVVPALAPDHDRLRALAESHTRANDDKVAFVFSWSDHGIEEEIVDAWAGWVVHPLPGDILGALRRHAPQPAAASATSGEHS